MSTDSNGAQSNAASDGAAVSADGRYVVFSSTASNLVPNDTNGLPDVFLKDRQRGITTAISVDIAGNLVGGTAPSMSSDARYIVFQSAFGNMVPGIPDSNGAEDVFLRDTSLNATFLVSFDISGTGSGNGASRNPTVSADGNFVAFESDATDLASLDNPGVTDVFVRDRQAGVTALASRNFTLNPSAPSNHAAISANGSFVAFASSARLQPGDGNNFRDIYVYGVLSGGSTLLTTAALPVGAQGDSDFPSISLGGGTVAYESTSTVLAGGDSNGVADIYMTTWFGGITHKRISVQPSGAQFTIPARRPSISDDGTVVSFHCVPPGSGTHPEMGVYLRDWTIPQTTLVSVSTTGGSANGQSPGLTGSRAVSDFGSHVVFHSAASTLVQGDSNGLVDTFVRDTSAPVFTPECFGDGSSIACPCGNNGLPGRGCENSQGTGGGLLVASGSPVLTADDLTLSASSLPGSTLALFIQSDTVVAPAFTDDGISCAGLGTLKIGEHASVGGSVSFGFGVAGDPAIHVAGGITSIQAPQTRHYSVRYRNAANFCTSSTSNWTNGIAIVWLP